MIKYIKDSIRELKHVVWPTREETNNYFITVVLVLLIFGIYLFIASTFFTKSLFGLKDFVDSKKTTVTDNIKIPETKKVKIPKIDSTTLKVEDKSGENVEVKTETKKVEETTK